MGWGYKEELLAAIAELVDVGNRYFFNAHKRKGVRSPEPVRIKRPGLSRRPRRRATRDDIKRIFTGGTIIVAEKEE